jgi:hypothetical protein
MTTQQQIDKLTQIAATTLDRIRALDPITATHTTQIGVILTSLQQLDADQRRTDASIRAMADERINTQREWQAYLRRIPHQ